MRKIASEKATRRTKHPRKHLGRVLDEQGLDSEVVDPEPDCEQSPVRPPFDMSARNCSATRPGKELLPQRDLRHKIGSADGEAGRVADAVVDDGAVAGEVVQGDWPGGVGAGQELQPGCETETSLVSLKG